MQDFAEIRSRESRVRYVHRIVKRELPPVLKVFSETTPVESVQK